jgi:molybdopterin-containing oxidoreductase family membrane subunit
LATLARLIGRTVVVRRSEGPSINRAAEAMTIFAVTHVPSTAWDVLGSAYWVFPPEHVRFAVGNFNSPLLWDVFAISTYSPLVFWYIGLIPDCHHP